MLDEVLVEGVFTGHERHERRLPPPPGATGLLAERGDGPGEGGDDGCVEAPDVDAELEGAGRNDPPQLAREESGFDTPALGGEVPGPVRGDPITSEPVRRPPVHELGRPSTAGERNGVEVCTDQIHQSHRCVGER